METAPLQLWVKLGVAISRQPGDVVQYFGRLATLCKTELTRNTSEYAEDDDENREVSTAARSSLF